MSGAPLVADWQPMPEMDHVFVRMQRHAMLLQLGSLAALALIATVVIALQLRPAWGGIAFLPLLFNVTHQIRRSNRLRRLGKELAPAHAMSWSATCVIHQDGWTTGDDYGAIWFEGGLLHFRGLETQFHLSPLDATAKTEHNLGILKVDLLGLNRQAHVALHPQDGLAGLDEWLEQWNRAPAERSLMPPLALHPRLAGDVTGRWWLWTLFIVTLLGVVALACAFASLISPTAVVVAGAAGLIAALCLAQIALKFDRRSQERRHAFAKQVFDTPTRPLSTSP